MGGKFKKQEIRRGVTGRLTRMEATTTPLHQVFSIRFVAGQRSCGELSDKNDSTPLAALSMPHRELRLKAEG
jgi:hypothetical protein